MYSKNCNKKYFYYYKFLKIKDKNNLKLPKNNSLTLFYKVFKNFILTFNFNFLKTKSYLFLFDLLSVKNRWKTSFSNKIKKQYSYFFKFKKFKKFGRGLRRKTRRKKRWIKTPKYLLRIYSKFKKQHKFIYMTYSVFTKINRSGCSNKNLILFSKIWNFFNISWHFKSLFKFSLFYKNFNIVNTKNIKNIYPFFFNICFFSISNIFLIYKKYKNVKINLKLKKYKKYKKNKNWKPTPVWKDKINRKLLNFLFKIINLFYSIECEDSYKLEKYLNKTKEYIKKMMKIFIINI